MTGGTERPTERLRHRDDLRGGHEQPGLVRVEPESGTDRLFYVGLNRAVTRSSNRKGSGVVAARFCLR